ncbi:Polar-differentiation response regulator DivK [Neomoorella glycerini]|uniref:Stage 0 sporulation protein A homolog n=1 Tax=Neomoorella glycerini TaxID=55779 RepID=A0A6I5ZWG7_9FIRM|nr:response regulator [Moorella glycerini]QGP93985.1 Polar-differentiation response regulator DivK [Moorella glycerini]
MLILLVEDNEANRVLMKDILTLTGNKILEAGTGEEGVRLAQKHKPQLIFMDVELPGMDGITATKILKQDARTRDIPVVAVSSYYDEKEKRLFLANGGDYYLSKPIDVELVLATVRRFLPDI